jgi:hypothetical protein
MLNAEDTLIQSAPGELLGALREIDQQAAHLRQRAQDALAAHVVGQGWSTETHNINLDLQSGMFTIVPKPEQVAA